MILAAEDIGMADPQALTLAVSAAEGVPAHRRCPRGASCSQRRVVYLATAPKSNAAYIAPRQGDRRRTRRQDRPGANAPCADAHYPGAKRLGHGKGYKYAHDAPHGIAEQEYLPDELRGARYYDPTGNGYEREVGPRLERLRALLAGKPMPKREAPPADATPAAGDST